MMKHKSTLYLLLLTALGGAGCFVFFQKAFPYHLLHREQILLFTYTAEQMSAYLERPAMLSCLAGDFLTQFFHFPVVGAALLTVLLLLTGALTFRLCRPWMRTGKAACIGSLVFVWESLRWCDLNHPMSGTLSLISGLALAADACHIQGKWTAGVSYAACTVLGYILFGYGMFVFATAVTLSCLLNRKHLTATLPVWLIALFLPPIAARTCLMPTAEAYRYPEQAAYGIPSRENERILGLCTADYQQQPEQIARLIGAGQPAGHVSVCYNLLNALHGQLSERLMDYYQPGAMGLFLPVNETSTYLSTQLAGEVWFHLGDMTMAEHAALLSMIFSPHNQSARMVQRLAEINLINGDEEAARKYLRILQHTLAYRQWADDRMPGQESREVRRWLEQKRSLLPKADTLRLSSSDVVKSLHLLLEACPANRMACEYLLCLDLLAKDLDAFARDYEAYHRGTPNRLYAEAWLIYLYRQRATAETVKTKGIAPATVKEFNQYNSLHETSQGNANVLRNSFGRTYWYYFQFSSL